ncbi:response regulator [Lacibacterium aquatile]|uniref:Response regulator n=1 Tax=Lacibacterium aquatile TaxID=1168082 RepID=A0ABW5DWM9_9PROT
MAGITLLVIGPSGPESATVTGQLERGGYRVTTVSTLADGLPMLDRLSPAIVVLTGTDSLANDGTVRAIGLSHPNIPVLKANVEQSSGATKAPDLLARVTALIAARQTVQLPTGEATALSGGLAHEFNNLLAIVLNNIEAARRQLERADPDLVRVRRATDNAADGATRAVALARHLLQGDRAAADPAPEVLPLFPAPAAPPASPAAVDLAAPRVLIVEDEILVRMMAVDALEINGFTVEEAGTAEAALKRIEMPDTNTIDAVIVDIGLPDRKGDVLAADLRARFPALPIVIASGYDESNFRQRFGGDPGMGFLAKPYDSAQLKNALRALGVVAS